MGAKDPLRRVRARASRGAAGACLLVRRRLARRERASKRRPPPAARAASTTGGPARRLGARRREVRKQRRRVASALPSSRFFGAKREYALEDDASGERGRRAAARETSAHSPEPTDEPSSDAARAPTEPAARSRGCWERC